MATASNQLRLERLWRCGLRAVTYEDGDVEDLTHEEAELIVVKFRVSASTPPVR